MEIKDSGNRRKFATGAMRDRPAGKGLPALCSPISEHRLALHFEGGAIKYGDRNWEQGMPVIEFLQSAKRHQRQYLEGDRSEDHLAAAEWNIHCAIHTEEMVKRGLLPKSLLDGLQNYYPKKCKRHPRYNGSKPPIKGCKVCQHIFEWNRYYDTSDWE